MESLYSCNRIVYKSKMYIFSEILLINEFLQKSQNLKNQSSKMNQHITKWNWKKITTAFNLVLAETFCWWFVNVCPVWAMLWAEARNRKQRGSFLKHKWERNERYKDQRVSFYFKIPLVSSNAGLIRLVGQIELSFLLMIPWKQHHYLHVNIVYR